jgi:hypothetical protein
MPKYSSPNAWPFAHAKGEPVIFHNLELRPDRAYFIYVGELKAYGLNHFLIPCLERVYGQPVDCIALAPDVLTHYHQSNLVVLNEESHRWRSRDDILVNCRPSAGQFAREVSTSGYVQELMEKILRQQEIIYLYMFESRPEMTLPDGERVRLLGPESSVAHRLNNKLLQYEMACKLGIPVPEGGCCECLEEALEDAENFFRSGDQVFISEAYSAAGSNSTFASCCEEIMKRFPGKDQPYLVTRRVPHSHDPTVLGVVANSEEVYVASVADQKMEENHFRGSTFPTILGGDVVETLKDCTRQVGKYIGAQGYRGIFGCDYIVDNDGQVYFVELNARKQGTTLESTLTMFHRLPGHPTLPEIEFHAFLQGKLPPGLAEMDSTESPLCWGTYNVKCERDVLVNREIPRSQSEAELFRRVRVERDYQAGAIVEDHIGPSVYQRAGGFVGRCISVGKTLPEMLRCLEETKLEVESSISSWTS